MISAPSSTSTTKKWEISFAGQSQSPYAKLWGYSEEDTSLDGLGPAQILAHAEKIVRNTPDSTAIIPNSLAYRISRMEEMEILTLMKILDAAPAFIRSLPGRSLDELTEVLRIFESVSDISEATQKDEEVFVSVPHRNIRKMTVSKKDLPPVKYRFDPSI